MSGGLVFAFLTGAVATVNPCGFALLPAYLARRLGMREQRAGADRIVHALGVGLSTTAGFLLVFGGAGTAIALGARSLVTVLPWAGLAVGVTLALIGVAVLAGRHVGLYVPLPRRVPADGVCGDVLFGVGYGIASLSCALPLFLAALATSLSGGLAQSALAFLAYAAGMGAILTVLAVAAALARAGLARFLRRLLPHVERASGLLLVAAGLYAAAYWTFALRQGANSHPGALLTAGGRISTALASWLSSADGERLTLVLAALLTSLALWTVWRHRSALTGRLPHLELSRPTATAVLTAVLLAAGAGGASFALASQRHTTTFRRSELRGALDPPAPAPPFALRDQFGRLTRLRDFRGQPVVLAFVYSHCHDICPLTANRIHAAQKALGAATGDVAWLALSVQPSTDTRSSVRAFSRKHGLLHSWRYLFGPPRHVLPILKAYGIQPQLGAAPDLQHSAFVILLDTQGKRIESFPDEALRTVDLVHDLRLVLGLPTHQQTAQTTRTPPAGPTEAPGASAHLHISLRDGVLALRGAALSGTVIDLNRFAGRPVVLNIWASWCAGCAAEAPALATLARRHPEAQVLGIDVEDTAAAGRSFVRRFQLPYPNLLDRGGHTTATLRVSGLPTTLYLDRRHHIVHRTVGESDLAAFQAGLSQAERSNPSSHSGRHSRSRTG